MSHIIRVSDWAYEQLKEVEGKKITDMVDMLINSYIMEHSGGPGGPLSNIRNAKLSDFFPTTDVLQNIDRKYRLQEEQLYENINHKIPKPPSEIIIFSILLAWNNGVLENNFLRTIDLVKTKYNLLNYKNDDLDQLTSRAELIKNSYKILHMFGWVRRYPDFFKGSSLEKIDWRGNFSLEFSSCLMKLRSINLIEPASNRKIEKKDFIKNHPQFRGPTGTGSTGLYKLSYKIEQETIKYIYFILSNKILTKKLFKLTKPYSFRVVEIRALEGIFIENTILEILDKLDKYIYTQGVKINSGRSISEKQFEESIAVTKIRKRINKMMDTAFKNKLNYDPNIFFQFFAKNSQSPIQPIIGDIMTKNLIQLIDKYNQLKSKYKKIGDIDIEPLEKGIMLAIKGQIDNKTLKSANIEIEKDS